MKLYLCVNTRTGRPATLASGVVLSYASRRKAERECLYAAEHGQDYEVRECECVRREPAEPLRIEDDTAYLGCMYCVSEGACPCAESECHYPTWERRVERVGLAERLRRTSCR